MKKLLTSLTILALISPITTANVNANEGIGEGSEPRKAETQASVEISGNDEIVSISASEKLEFNKIVFNFAQAGDYETTAQNPIELTVTDTRYSANGYTIKAKFSSVGENNFPSDTVLHLEPFDDINSEYEDNALPEAPKFTSEDNFILKLNDDDGTPVLSAERTTTKPFEGAGTWKAQYEAVKLSIPHKTLKPGVTLKGTITWTIEFTSK